jgi:TolA-binding protein
MHKNYVNLAVCAVMVIFLSTVFGCASTQDVHEGSASALYHQGVRLVNKGRYAQAKEVFHEYIASYGDTHLYPVSLYYLGYCYQKLDDPKQARLIYHKVIDQTNDEFWTQMSKKRLQELESEISP